VPILAIAACVFLMANLQRVTWLAFFIWLAVGLTVYFAYSRTRSKLANGRSSLRGPVHSASG
jgi:APA family basic amino acid/polyamine antiporter